MTHVINSRQGVPARFVSILLIATACWSVKAQIVQPACLYAVLNSNTQLVTINATNAQVINSIAITGIPTNWSFGNVIWSTRDTTLYAVCYNIQATPVSIFDMYLVRLDPSNGVAQVNAFLGSFVNSPRLLYEGLAFVDSLQELVVARWEAALGSDLSSKELGILSTNGVFTLMGNNGRDNDLLAYDSRRSLLYSLDAGNETLPNLSNTFDRTSLSNAVVQQLYSYKISTAACTYHRGLDAFYVSYLTNGIPQLYRWTTDGNTNVSQSLVGPITGISAGLNLSALAPAPYPPVISLRSPESTTQTVCVAKSFPLATRVAQGNAPIKIINYFDGPLLIGSSTNAKTSFVTNAFLAPGIHQISAQAFDGYLNATSQTEVVLLVPPAPDYMAAQLVSGGTGLACCLGGTVSNDLYVIQSTTNLADGPSGWLPLSTNRAFSDLLVFTNAPTDKARFFRAVLP